MVKLSATCPLNRAEFFASCSPDPVTINCGELHFGILIRLWRSFLWFFDGFLFRCYFAGGAGGGAGQGCHWGGVGVSTKAFRVPLNQLCTSCQQHHRRIASSLLFNSQWEHGSWTSSWFLATAQSINAAPGCRRTTDPDKALGRSTDLGHPHGLRWQHRLQTPEWWHGPATSKILTVGPWTMLIL